MPANIYGKHFAERNGTAWHGIGTRLEGKGASATEALKEADLDFGVEKRTLYYRTGSEGGMYVPTNHVAVIRPEWHGDEEAVLGVVTDDYQPLQNGELCKLLDPLTGEWPVETIGALGKGETLFLTLDAGHRTVGGDELAVYFFVYNKHDGSSALKLNITPVRVVCANTCVTGLARAYVTADVAHTRSVHREAEFAIGLVAQLRRAQEATITALDGLTKIQLTSAQIRRVVEATYPARPAPAHLSQLDLVASGDLELTDERVAELTGRQLNYEQAELRSRKLRLATRELFEAFNDARPDYARTGWAMYNAVTELASHRGGGNAQQRVVSILDGPRGEEMKRAFNELQAIGAGR